MSKDSLQLSEIFFSSQGEGPHIGKPAIFIRLAGCNLSCPWCDTKHAFKGQTQPIQKIVYDTVKLIEKYDPLLIVITGGEPLIQLIGLTFLVRRLRVVFKGSIEIETNGTIGSELISLDDVDFMAISPKLSDINKKVLTRYVSEAILNMEHNNTIKHCFKFVVGSSNELLEVYKLVQEFKIPKELVYIMPKCKTEKRQKAVLKWLLPLAGKSGFSITPRLHVLAFDNQRGV